MSRSRRARKRNAAVLIGLAVLLVVAGTLSADAAWFPLAALLMLAAWFVSPYRPDRSTSHWVAQQRLVKDERMIVYWRPGCYYCLRLRLALGRRVIDVDWVDIWSDDEGAAFVRDINGGAETVPTVIYSDGSAHTNPGPRDVLLTLGAGRHHRPEARPSQ